MALLRPAPDEFHQRLRRLIAAYHPHLAEARILLQVRDAARQSVNRNSAWAEVDTPNNEAEAAQYDFALWFALEPWAQLTDHQRDALVDHELTHCVWDENGAPALLPHNIEEFDAILARYGVWWPDAHGFIQAIRLMPHAQAAGAERNEEMPSVANYQRPMWGGSSGSTGVGGSSGSTGVGGSSGSTGVYGAPVWSDPDLVAGQDFHTIDIGNGRVLELTPQAFQAAVASILADLQNAMGGPEQGGSSGSTGV